MRLRAGLGALTFAALAVPAVALTLGGPPASAGPEDLPSAIEDHAYPGAEAFETQRGIKLIAGDGHILDVPCVPGAAGQIQLFSRALNDPDMECFQVSGPVGYLALEIPEVYTIKGDADHAVKATVTADETTTTLDVKRDAFTAVGEGTSQDGAVLVALEAKPADGSNQPALAANTTHPYLGRLNVGEPGRQGGRACTASLVSAKWVLTAASCFGNEVATAGPPAQPTTVSFGARTAITVTRVISHPDQDLAVARLATPVADVAPATVATATPAAGQGVQVVGYGRTATRWMPDTSHAVGATLSEIADDTVTVTATSGGVCQGDAGAPLLDAAGQIAAVVNRSGQQGCLAADNPIADAAGTIANASWINERVQGTPAYIRNAHAGKCLDVVGASTANGARVQMYDCWGSSNQQWTYNAADGSIRSVQTGKCLDIVNAGTANGAEIGVWDCWGAPNQKWTVNANGTISNPQTGRCLDIVNAGTANGARLQLFDCYATWNQLWGLSSTDDEVRNPQSGNCLDVIGASTDNGARVQMYPCWGSSNQKWMYQPSDGTIRSLQTGKCLDIVNGNTANTAEIGVWDCWGAWNQKWTVNPDGTIRNPQTGRCIDIVGQSTAAGARLQLFDCYGFWNQLWTLR